MSVLMNLASAISSCTPVLRRSFHSSVPCHRLQKLSRLRVVDNSELGKQAMLEGKPPRIIQVYNKTGIGTTGDIVLCAIKGLKKKGVIVGVKAKQPCFSPRTDSNNVVLIEDNGAPLGTRIVVPIPSVLRTILKEKTHAKGADYTKVLSIATRFV
ncbi:39S ribosomal protein L14, mitochondrial [Frankliniella fusca]|uniref:Large ribosomal subunit protein uL14m n=1 Tax=Frankliniella fusca TaxID=407009 RepID=A0AAE1LES2_9NEOP|nr:39S ribosomal protein L14, mitochondrial [Frankliniella fusca]